MRIKTQDEAKIAQVLYLKIVNKRNYGTKR